ncbi:unnamed protein product [Anisakis simplex]|uniref:G_PROTEIN_RECEP_F1_2 domain-containing protein n=1 Tax=Anisakis simplex TaxID=6269 RepID=A0A0M3JQ40_ANISI|nr:unnamed protein product [Anisakis simplex]
MAISMTLFDVHGGLLLYVCGVVIEKSIPLSVLVLTAYDVMLLMGIFTHPIAFLYRYAFICQYV